MSALTPKQQRFVEEYLVDLNATQAATRAGYSARTANEQGARLLANASVRAAIDSRKVKRAEKTELTAKRVLEEIRAMAFWDPADLVEITREIAPNEDAERLTIIEVDGERLVIDGVHSPRDIKKLPESIRRAIVGWGYDRNQNFTLKLADKSKALDQLARHLALYNDKLDVTVTDKLAERVARAKKRTAG